jgi:hypothetical protein
MPTRITHLVKYVAMVSSGIVWGSGCAGTVARELEVFFAAAASPFLIRESVLVEVFGLQILRMFN